MIKIRHIVLIACCAVSFVSGLSVRPEPKTVQKTVFVTEYKPYSLPLQETGYTVKQRNILAAVINASQLGGNHAR